MGRPKKNIDEKKVARLALDGCQLKTIARIMGEPEGTIRSRFQDLIEKKRAERKHKLLKKQNEVAESGDRTMLIWLGKAVLHQVERQIISGDKSSPFHIVIHEYGDKKRKERADGDTD